MYQREAKRIELKIDIRVAIEKQITLIQILSIIERSSVTTPVILWTSPFLSIEKNLRILLFLKL